ncbi:MAG: aminotransferase class V-fold PLP-dependent enzyme [Oscillospiraceae bacterium]|nr:aminotransferase class V-fold PLP-dependent enzyme [Oscillospiraceae bacterium]
MIYLDNGATTLHKPAGVSRAMLRALRNCANPGRGGHPAAMAAMRTVFDCREKTAAMFDCDPEQVVFTANCTHGLNVAIRTLVKPGSRVVISGFEHNAVTRPLHGLGAKVTVAGRRLFDPENTLEEFEKALRQGADVAIFTHVSNVFGYILPVEELAALCRRYKVPFIVDAAQSAGVLPVSLQKWGADFIAMPGHKGLLGPQGTGILLCGRLPEPLLMGGTGSVSLEQNMPLELPDRAEAGTLNVPGIAGLSAGLDYLSVVGIEKIFAREREQAQYCIKGLQKLGVKVFAGPHQSGTVSFAPPGDCEEFAGKLSRQGIAVRAGLHCAPTAHESAGTLDTGTVRVSFGHDATALQTQHFLRAAKMALED